MEGLFYDMNDNETEATKCMPRSNCIQRYGRLLCDSLGGMVCSDSDSKDENSPSDTGYTYFDVDSDSNDNSTFYSHDQPYGTHEYGSYGYSHISPSTWGFLIMFKILFIIFLRMFCCSYRRKSILFVPSFAHARCHEISNPISEHQQHQQSVDVLPTVVVESSRQKDESPPPPYPTVAATNCVETLPPPDYSSLFPSAPTSSSS